MRRLEEQSCAGKQKQKRHTFQRTSFIFQRRRVYPASSLFVGRLYCVLAEWTGLEPATPGVTGRYSNQLNYHSKNV